MYLKSDLIGPSLAIHHVTSYSTYSFSFSVSLHRTLYDSNIIFCIPKKCDSLCENIKLRVLTHKGRVLRKRIRIATINCPLNCHKKSKFLRDRKNYIEIYLKHSFFLM